MDVDDPVKRGSYRKGVLAAGVGIVAFFFVVDDLLGWINGGGIFSIVAAIRAVQDKVPQIEVDSAGLRIAFIAACGLVVTAMAVQLPFDAKRPGPQVAFMVAIMIGGLALDAVYGASAIETFMARHNYRHCEARDRTVGAGKGHVRLHDYVVRGAECPALAAAFAPPVIKPVRPVVDPRTVLPRPALAITPPATWITQDDYPATAARRGFAGLVQLSYVVEADGRVRHCAPISSSGSPLLDMTACGLVMTNARYWPARDTTGKAMPVSATLRVRWQLPDN